AGRNFQSHELPRVRSLIQPSLPSGFAHRRLRSRSLQSVSHDGLPVNFTTITKWPKCLSLRQIRQQGDCSSGYAHSVAATITDRLCIATGQSVNMSAEDITACDMNQQGCAGGRTDLAWQFYMDQGVVTGGPYNTTQ
ncbi:hypothetical protein RRG08_058348, partial [Elysia crispata]